MNDHQNMEPPSSDQQFSRKKQNSIQKLIISAVIVMLISVLAFSVLVPLLGITLVMTGAAWGFMISTVVLFSIAGMVFFVVPGLLIFLISLFALVWLILVIVLFPLLFPIILPVFIVVLFIALIRRKS